MKPVICTQCGEKPPQTATGFRFFVRGYHRCDACAPKRPLIKEAS